MTGLELFNKLTARLGKSEINLDFLTAINATTGVIAKRLWNNRSDFLRSDFSVAFTADNPDVTLPAGFLGFVERPYVVVGTTQSRVAPLPPETDNAFTATGTPQYYEMRGTVLAKLYPTPSANGTMKGKYFAKPTDLTALSGTIPFGGFFDDVYLDALLMVAQQGMFVVATPLFDQTMSKQVDITISSRAPRRVTWRQMP